MKLDLVDVFGSEALRGNPLGVVHCSSELPSNAMLRLTQWLGFSETTFILPATDPSADYKVRIFYPAGELPFAGHPTLGTCHAWLEAGGRPRADNEVVQECGIGLVRVRRDGPLLAFAAPPLTRSGPLSQAERNEAARIAGVDEEWIVEAVHLVNGPQWKLLRLRSASDVLQARPVTTAPDGTDVGLAGPIEEEPGTWELRAFFSNQHGALIEDPVTGSFNAGVALHLFGNGLAERRYAARQGRLRGADGRIECVQDADGRVWIGGRCKTIARGAAMLAMTNSTALPRADLARSPQA